MSGSVGGAPIPATALDVLEPAILRWLYVRRLSAQSFPIDLSPKRGAAPLRRVGPARRARSPPARRPPTSSRSTASRPSPRRARWSAPPRPVSFRLLASVADLTQGDRAQIARIVAAHLGLEGDAAGPRGAAGELCSLAWTARSTTRPSSFPRASARGVRSGFDPAASAALDQETRDAVAQLSERMTDDWSIEGLTKLVYAIPKRMRGLSPDEARPRPRSSRPSARSSRRSTASRSVPIPGRGCPRCCSRSALSAPASSLPALRAERRTGDRARRLTLVAMSLGFAVVQLDVSVLNVAVRSIGADLGGGVSEEQWVLNAYTIGFAAFILTAGSLGDRIGARRVFVAGFALFMATSAVCGLAPGLGVLIAAPVGPGDRRRRARPVLADPAQPHLHRARGARPGRRSVAVRLEHRRSPQGR